MTRVGTLEQLVDRSGLRVDDRGLARARLVFLVPFASRGVASRARARPIPARDDRRGGPAGGSADRAEAPSHGARPRRVVGGGFARGARVSWAPRAREPRGQALGRPGPRRAPALGAVRPVVLPDDHAIRFAGLGADGAGSRLVTLRELRERLPNRQWAPCPHDWHCVTGWSALGLELRGAPRRGPRAPRARRPAQGEPRRAWCASPGLDVPVPNLRGRVRDGRRPRDLAGAFLAVEWKPPSAPENAAASDDDRRDAGFRVIPPEHGGPRLVFPALFGWKSAKWLSVVEFRPALDAGFWERLGVPPAGAMGEGGNGGRRRAGRGRRGWSRRGDGRVPRRVRGCGRGSSSWCGGGWLVGVVARLAGALKRR